MKLSKELARMVEEDLQDIFKNEIADDQFMPQADYNSCLERAEDMISAATNRATQVLALAIIKHREEKHKEDRKLEKEEIIELLHDEDVSVGLMSWWNH